MVLPTGVGVAAKGVAVAVPVGVAVAWTTVITAPVTGKPLNNTAWPLVPLAPVRLKL